MTSEYRVRTEGRGRTVDEWHVKPEHHDNHWFDCLVGSTVAASVLGLGWSASVALGEPPVVREPRKKVKLSEVYAQKNGARR